MIPLHVTYAHTLSVRIAHLKVSIVVELDQVIFLVSYAFVNHICTYKKCFVSIPVRDAKCLLIDNLVVR